MESQIRMTKPDSKQEVAAEWVSVDALKPWAQNPRINDDAVPEVAKSIRRFGFGSPILARKADGEIIAGHTRLKAAMSLGLERVPVRYLDLDPAEAHLLALADNRLAEEADWDNGQLAAILADYKIGDAQSSGFDLSEISKLLDEAEEDFDLDDVDPVLSDKLSYQVIIECKDEEEQTELLHSLRQKGKKCKALVV